MPRSSPKPTLSRSDRKELEDLSKTLKDLSTETNGLTNQLAKVEVRNEKDVEIVHKIVDRKAEIEDKANQVIDRFNTISRSWAIHLTGVGVGCRGGSPSRWNPLPEVCGRIPGLVPD